MTIGFGFVKSQNPNESIFTDNKGGTDTTLANHKSALKRVKQNENRRLRNRIAKTQIKNIVKDVRINADASDREAVLKQLNLAQSIIDKGAKKGTIHKNTASRKISRLTKRVNSATP